MKQEWLEQFPDRQSGVAIRKTVTELCSRYGHVAAVDLIHVSDGSHYCYVEMAQPDARFNILRELGGIYSGIGILFNISCAS